MSKTGSAAARYASVLAVSLLLAGCFALVPSDEKNITGFNFLRADNEILPEDVIGTIGDTTVTAVFLCGTDLTALVPTITVSRRATVSPESGVVQDFSGPVLYTVTADDGTTQTYSVRAASSRPTR